MDKKQEDKIDEAIKCLSAGEDHDYHEGLHILSSLLDHDLEKSRRGWRKKVKEAYYCFHAEKNEFQKGLDLLLQTKGQRLAIYVERQKDHDSVSVDDIESENE